MSFYVAKQNFELYVILRNKKLYFFSFQERKKIDKSHIFSLTLLRLRGWRSVRPRSAAAVGVTAVHQDVFGPVDFIETTGRGFAL